MNRKDGDGVVPAGKRASVERQIMDAKISPEQMTQLIENNDPHILAMIARKTDLSPQDAIRILGHGRTASSHKMYKDAATKVRDLAVQNVRNHGQLDAFAASDNEMARKSFLGRASSAELLNFLDGDRINKVTPGEAMTLVRRAGYGQEHAIELLRHQNPDVARQVFSYNAKVQPGSNAVIAATHHARPEIRKQALNSKSLASLIPERRMLNLLDDPDSEVRTAVLRAADSPAVIQAAIDKADRTEHPGELFENAINNNKILPEQIEALYDKMSHLPNAQEKISQGALQFTGRYGRNDKVFSPSLIDKLVKHPNIHEKFKTYLLGLEQVSPQTLEYAGRNSTDPKQILQTMSNPGTPAEQLPELWGRIKDHVLNHREWEISSALHHIVGERQDLPPNMLNDMLGSSWADNSSMRRVLLGHRNTPIESIVQAANSANPEIRADVATVLKDPPEALITQGLKDKDKYVRAAWIESAPLSVEHQKIILKDRASSNKLKMLKRKDISPLDPSVLSALLRDKDISVAKSAAYHPDLTPQQIRDAFNDTTTRSEVLQTLLSHESTPADTVGQAIERDLYTLSQARTVAERNRSLTAAQLKKLHSAYPEDSLLMREIGAHPSADRDLHNHLINSSTRAETLGQIAPYQKDADSAIKLVEKGLSLQRHVPHFGPVEYEAAKVMARNLSTEELLKFHNHFNSNADIEEAIVDGAEGSGLDALYASNPDSEAISKRLAEKSANPETLRAIAARAVGAPDEKTLIKLTHNDHSPGDVLHQIINYAEPNIGVDDGSSYLNSAGNLAVRALKHPNVSDDDVLRLARHPFGAVAKAAGQKIAHINPDSFNDALNGSSVEIHPATEKLKHLKGLVEDAGGQLHKKDLPPMFQNIPGQLLDGKGFVTPVSVDNYLKTMPKAKYNISFGRWTGAQKHSSDPQKVLQVNLTNDHVKQMKEEGVYDTFKKMFEDSYKSGHPVERHTIGWARLDESHPGHVHIDEIQSDFGQGTIRQIEQIRDKGKVDKDHADLMISHLKKIGKILAGPFKSINRMISGATHEYARSFAGAKTTSMDMPEDQYKQSGFSSDRSPPGHAIDTYKSTPEELGYSPADKKGVMPETDSSFKQVQLRKLVKSLQNMRELLQKIQ
jgi:hypothetical protein